MSPFWSISLFWICTLAFVAVALLFVVPPLWRGRSASDKASRREVNIAVYRDQMKELDADLASGEIAEDQYRVSKRELEARLAEDALAQEDTADSAGKPDRRLVWGLVAAVPLAAFAIYFWLGTPAAFMNAPAGGQVMAEAAPEGMPAQSGGDKPHASASAFVQQLEEKAKAEPQNGQAQADLGFAYAMTGRFPDAFRAYSEAAKLLPNDASILSAYAEVTAIVHNDNLEGRPMELVKKALAINPNEVRALLLSGQYAFGRNDYAKAADFFERAAGQLGPQDPVRGKILDQAQEARRLAKGGTPMAQLDNLMAAPAQPAPAAGGNGRISGTVELAPALKARAGANDTVYIVARGPAGGMPLAALKGKVSELPLSFELNDGMAMTPGNTLSSQPAVTVVARISKSGDVMPKPGDLEGSVAGVKVGSSGVRVLIDKAR
jgi:cytochrome c-type biogenesis protein CcmH